jgi:chromate transporter
MNADEAAKAPVSSAPVGRWIEVLAVFFRLGLTSFGGPVAHLGYFRDEFVVRRRWLDDRTYADLVALCQFLPGPASSRHRHRAIALVIFAFGVNAVGDVSGAGWLHGLKVVVVAVVAQAVLGMMRSLTPDRERATMAVIAAAIVFAVPGAWGQIGAIFSAASRGASPSHRRTDRPRVASAEREPRHRMIMLVVFFAVLIGLPLLAIATNSQGVKLFEALCYRC